MMLRGWERRVSSFTKAATYAALFMLCALAALSLSPRLIIGAPVATAIQDETPGQDEETDGPANPRMHIELGDGFEIVIELLPEDAPKAVERITKLAEEGYYNGERFHRVESYLVQAGRKETDLEPIEGEMFMQELTHEEGMVGMARLQSDYDSATNQFYICKEHLPTLNGEYTLFGRVITGMDYIKEMKKGCKIKNITIERWPGAH